MKQLWNQTRKSLLVTCFGIAALSLLFVGCSKSDGYVSATVTYSLSGNANSSQAVPANNSNGSGTFSGTYNATTKVMTYTSTWSNLSGALLSGAFYTGASGQNGVSISSWSLGSGLGASGSFSGSAMLNADQEAKLLSGNCYYILGTAAYASGEIRGQITATKQ
ncbi:MAG: hypothetical protein NVSMB63_14920 [Sediminibacterium sp.]